ncbi:hypothetical protein ACFLRO_01645 [Bacteroidota bacterium]
MIRGTSFVAIAILIIGPVARPVAAQAPVTIRTINRISDENIRDLMTGGVDLTEQDIRDLIQSPLDGDTVSVRAVVLTNPRNSGLSEVSAGRVARVHFFVRDLEAISMGNAGMAIQVIDDLWQEHGVLQLSVGHVVDLTAVVSEFQNGLFLDPIAIEQIGDFENFDLPPSLFSADTTFRVEDLNRPFGNGTFQADWRAYSQINGSPVCFNRATVDRILIPAATGRVDWSVTTDDSARIYIHDLSHRFRNDRQSSYPPDFNLRESDFDVPPLGAVVTVCGFVLLHAFSDPEAVGIPIAVNTGSMFSLIPIDDTDLRIRERPPSIDSVSQPDVVLRSNVGYQVSALISADPTRTVTSVTLTYVVGRDTTSKVMLDRGHKRWVSTIPPTAVDGAVVRYQVKASDSSGLDVASSEHQYRVLDRGIRSIRDIQMTYDGGPGPSPFADSFLPLDIEGIVQSHPDRSGLVAIQDDTLLLPWSGILLDPASASNLGLENGSRIRIARAQIEEIDGVTHLSSLTVKNVSRGGPSLGYVAVSTAALQEASVAESYEGMVVQITSAVSIEQIGNGDWSTSNSHLAEYIRLTNRYSEVPDDGIEPWELRPFVRGVWIETGSDWMLALETPDDLGEVVNVGVTPDELVAGPGMQIHPASHVGR